MKFIYVYSSGFNNCKCLVEAKDELTARELFFKSHPTLRPYNLISVQTATRAVYELRG